MSARSSARRSRRPSASPLVSVPRTGVAWLLVSAVFLVGLMVRISAFTVPREFGPGRTEQIDRWRPSSYTKFLENDEKIYLAVISQLDAGRGYTLRGHPILNEPWLAADQYGQALFFHPPGPRP